MTYRAHRAVVRRQKKLKRDAMREHFERKSKNSLVYNRRLGGTYTSATFIALMGLIDTSDDLEGGDRISMFSYGSGSCAEFYSLKVAATAREIVGQARFADGLDERRKLTVPEYEAIEELRMSYVNNPDLVTDRQSVPGLWDSHYAGKGRVYLDKVDGWDRYYAIS